MQWVKNFAHPHFQLRRTENNALRKKLTFSAVNSTMLAKANLRNKKAIINTKTLSNQQLTQLIEKITTAGAPVSESRYKK